MSAVLSVRDLHLKRAAREILKGVSFEVVRGEVVALMGLSGSGKTTILRAVADLEPEGRTAVQVAGSDSGDSTRRSGARVGMVFQFHFLFEHLSVLDNICLAPVRVHGVTRADAATRAMQWLTQLGIAHRAAALPRELSGGEAQRAAIARAVAMDPPVLLLDEPTASLDPPRRTSLGVLLNELAAQGRALLVTSHDVDFVRDHATRVLILADGLLVEQGPPRVVFSAPQHEATRSLLQSTVPSTVAARP